MPVAQPVARVDAGGVDPQDARGAVPLDRQIARQRAEVAGRLDEPGERGGGEACVRCLGVDAPGAAVERDRVVGHGEAVVGSGIAGTAPVSR
jgi:hypothetical protein